MEDLWNSLAPLLSTLWGTLVEIVMICVDTVLGFIADRIEEPLETWDPYVWVHDNEGLTTGIILFLLFLMLRSGGKKETVVKEIVKTPAPQPTSRPMTENTPQSSHQAASKPSPQNCHHDWQFTHKGVDAKYPRGHYQCRICDAAGVEETYGDGRISLLR